MLSIDIMQYDRASSMELLNKLSTKPDVPPPPYS